MKETIVALVSRHGQTALNHQKAFRSWLDVPLDETGIEQAKRAADFLKRYKIKEIVCSPLLRAFVTATIAGASHDLTPVQHRGLFPWHLGVFAGRPRESDNDALKLFVENPEIVVPNGESLDAFESRQFTFWEAALKMARRRGLTLFVAHTSNLVALEKFTLDEPKAIQPEQSETVKPGGIAAVYWNGASHRVEPIFGSPEKSKFGGS